MWDSGCDILACGSGACRSDEKNPLMDELGPCTACIGNVTYIHAQCSVYGVPASPNCPRLPGVTVYGRTLNNFINGMLYYLHMAPDDRGRCSNNTLSRP